MKDFITSVKWAAAIMMFIWVTQELVDSHQLSQMQKEELRLSIELLELELGK